MDDAFQTTSPPSMLTLTPTAAAARNVGGRPSGGKCDKCRRRGRACSPSCPNWPGLQQTAEVAAASSLPLTSTAASVLSQPHGERTVLTKPKILTVKIEWLRMEERHNAPKRYIMSAATYQRLIDAVKL